MSYPGRHITTVNIFCLQQGYFSEGDEGEGQKMELSGLRIPKPVQIPQFSGGMGMCVCGGNCVA